jgi:nicotinate-nucleotide adenylyltransferase
LSGLRIGVFGGAFDPPHQTHAALVEVAVAQLHLDQIKLIPTGDAWHKSRPLTAAAHRLAMAHLAFAALPRVVVDDRETRRSGPSYTVDTLRELKAENLAAQLFLIIGGDQAQALAGWHQSEQIRQLATICVAERAGLTGANALFDAQNTSSTPPLQRLNLPLSATSATQIRALVAQGQDVRALVGEPVARYIALHHLYQTAR